MEYFFFNSTSGSRQSIRLDYAPFLLDKIVRPLIEHGADGVAETMAVLGEYHLLREDIDSLIELTTWPGKKSAFDRVDGKVKAALTRAYNKNAAAYSYSSMAGVKKKKTAAAEEEMLEEGGGGGSNDGEQVLQNSDEEDKDDDNVENDGLIKAVKKVAPKSGSSKGKSGNSSGARSKSSGSSGKGKSCK